jgi:hypothetical protein
MKIKALYLTAFILLCLVGGLFAQNGALYFDGVNDVVAVGDMDSASTPIKKVFTVEAWFNPASIGTTGSGEIPLYGRAIIASSRPAGPTGTAFTPIWVSQKGSEIWVFASGAIVTSIKTVGLGLQVGTWYHVAVSVAANRVVTLYVNGVPKGTGITHQNPALDWEYQFTIGDLRPDKKLPFHGSIDEVRVWNYVRTANEISDNYLNTGLAPSPGLLGNWKLDGNALDSSGFGFHGTVQDGLTPVQNPPWVPGRTLNDITLPVELSSFTAVLTADLFVRLQWTTQSETGVSGFYIYRGISSKLADAIIVSPLIAPSNTSELHNYEFVDAELYDHGTYYYWLSVHNMDGSVDYHGPNTVLYNPGTHQDIPEIPQTSGISSVYPNPFNPNTNIAYILTKDAEVNFVIYNSRGQIVRRIAEGPKAAGNWKLIWNGLDENANSCATGVYYIRLNAGNESFVKKATLMK